MFRLGGRWLWLTAGALVLLAAAALLVAAFSPPFRSDLVGSLRASWGQLVLLIAIVLLETSLLDAIMRPVVARLREVGLSQGLVRLGASLVRWGLILLGLVIVLDMLNLNAAVGALLGLAGVIGLGVSLALRGLASDLVSGVIMALDPDIEVGDRVRVNGVEGTIVDVQLLHTLIRQEDDSVALVPNTKMTNGVVVNYRNKERRPEDRG